MNQTSMDVSLLSSSLSGILHIIVGYPFDTVKTLQQGSNNINISSISIKRLFKGIKHPLIQNSIINSTCFGLNNYFLNNIENKHFGTFLTSLTSTLIIAPFDKMKIMNQYNMNFAFNIDIIKKSYKNIHLICACEIPSTFLYFSIYRELKNKNVPVFICGGLAGVGAWLIPYPIDTIKTRLQNESCKTIKEAFNKGGLYKGLFICISRSFIVNGLNFYSYEYFVKLFSRLKTNNI